MSPVPRGLAAGGLGLRWLAGLLLGGLVVVVVALLGGVALLAFGFAAAAFLFFVVSGFAVGHWVFSLL